jgi:bla regulator protein blaR1
VLAAWMVYVVVVTCLVGLGAMAWERVLSLLGRPVRWVWPGALAASLLVAGGTWLVAGGPEADVSHAHGAADAGAAPETAPLFLRLPTSIGVDPAGTLGRLDRPLAVAWAGGVAGLLAWFGAAAFALRSRRRDWKGMELRGRQVLISRDEGPGIVGLIRNQVILPRWCLALPETAVELVLVHEEEHRRAGDTRLLVPMIAAAILLPWNLPLWWMVDRYRQAAELDCDARVLRRFPEYRKVYGELLLLVCSRGVAPMGTLTTFAESDSTLERRIRMLTQISKERQLRRALVLGVVGGLLIVVACLVPGPDGDVPDLMGPEEAPLVDRTPLAQEPTFTPYEVEPEVRNPSEIRAALAAEYPPILRDAGIGGVVMVYFFIDEEGVVAEAQVKQPSGHQALDQAAVRAARQFRFSPALNQGEPVPVWVQIPIRFETR